MCEYNEKTWTTSDNLTGTYMATGAGPIVVMIHGGGSRAAHFSELAEQLDGRISLLAPDLRGFGKFHVPTGHPISFENWAEDVCDFIEGLDCGPVVLCGWSLGASLALLASARRPKLVARLVLFGAADPERKVDRSFFERRLAKLDEGAEPSELLAEIKPHIAAMISATHPGRDGIVENLLGEQLGNLGNLREVTRAYFTRPDLVPAASAVAVPTTLVVGEQDRTCDLAQAQRLAALIDECTIVTVPDCGHYYFVERPAQMTEILLRTVGDAQDRGVAGSRIP